MRLRDKRVLKKRSPYGELSVWLFVVSVALFGVGVWQAAASAETPLWAVVLTALVFPLGLWGIASALISRLARHEASKVLWRVGLALNILSVAGVTWLYIRGL